MAKAAKLETEPVFGVGIFPTWNATAEQKTMKYLEAEYSGFAYLVQIPPGAKFNFSAPDHWTGQKSVFNTGNNTHWGVDIIVIANAAGWEKYYDPLVFEDELDRACASTLGTNLYVTGTGLMATDSQVTLNSSPGDDHPSLQH